MELVLKSYYFPWNFMTVVIRMTGQQRVKSLKPSCFAAFIPRQSQQNLLAHFILQTHSENKYYRLTLKTPNELMEGAFWGSIATNMFPIAVSLTWPQPLACISYQPCIEVILGKKYPSVAEFNKSHEQYLGISNWRALGQIQTSSDNVYPFSS